MTGATVAEKNSIQLDFFDSDGYGTISALTCSRVVMFPRGVFSNDSESYEKFKLAMIAVTGASPLSFNTV